MHNIPKEKDRFPTSSPYRDLWAALLFIAVCVAYITLSAIFCLPRTVHVALEHHHAILAAPILLSLASGCIFALCFLFFIQRFASVTIKVTLALSVLIYVAWGCFLFFMRSYIAGGIILVFALLYAWAAYTWRSRIPFAAIMLSTVARVTRRFPGTVYVAIFGLLLQIGWCLLFILTAAGIYRLSGASGTQDCVRVRGRIICPSSTPSGIYYAAYVGALFSFYWGSQVLQSIVHVVTAGVFGAFYYLSHTPLLPHSPTLGALKRTLTTSFGSVCFGSLIIAVIRTLRALANIASQDSQDSALAFLACCAACILGCIEGIAEWFNRYAFSHVAVYGKAFVPAAKDTWNMIKNRGVEALINDDLIGNVSTAAALLSGGLGALVAFLVMLAISKAHALDGGVTLIVIVCVLGFVAGFTPVAVVTGVVESGVVATFVCLAEDPQALARNQPILFEQVRNTWPHIIYGV